MSQWRKKKRTLSSRCIEKYEIVCFCFLLVNSIGCLRLPDVVIVGMRGKLCENDEQKWKEEKKHNLVHLFQSSGKQ